MINPTATLTTVLRNFDKIGATLPKPVAAQHAKLADLTTKVHALDLNHNLPGAVLDALANGNDPLTDETVQREAARRRIGDMPHALEAALGARAQDLIDTHAATILEAMRKPFDTAAEAVANAYDQLGDVALDDTHAILAKRGDAARMWAQAKDADRTITTIHQTWGVLAGATATVNHESMYRLLVIADIDPAAWLDEGLRNTTLTAWETVRAGHRLDYATPDTLAQRVQAILQEQQRRQSAAEGEFRTAYRRLHGGVGVA